jgi:hypothetical protein
MRGWRDPSLTYLDPSQKKIFGRSKMLFFLLEGLTSNLRPFPKPLNPFPRTISFPV